MSAFFGDCALAQTIIEDDTLGAERSRVMRNGLIDQIDGGAIRGANLFHSFEEFSVEANRGAYFFSPANIQNILARVTGVNPSLILGTIGTFGDSTPNLFLINPNGIIFGPNAKLDVGGSFVATTANAIQFGNQGFFSASTPEAPPLLTVSPSAFFFNALSNEAEIVNRSIATTPVLGFSFNGLPSISGLQVPDGRSLLLVGSDVKLENGGRLNALGGRIELGGLAATGIIGLETNGNILSLNFAPNSLLSNVTLANDARGSVRGLGGGSIVINANTFSATNGGRLVAGTEGLGNGGDIIVNANEFRIIAIGLSGAGSGLYNESLAGASGNAGNIFVNTGSFHASEGASVGSFTSGSGKGGSINIQAESLSLSDGARLIASTFGLGDAGNVTVTATDAVSFDGVGSNGIFSTAASTVSLGAVGNGGDVNITSRSLSVTNGAGLTASTFGQGNAGNVNINARDTVSFDGVGSDGGSSTAASRVASGAVGNGGSVNITTGSLSITNGAGLTASTFGQGDAGNVNINARDMVSFDGVGSNGLASGAASQVELGAVGNSGNINITAGSFSVTKGAGLSASTFGQGDAGNVNINARDMVSFDGVGSNGFSSEVASRVESGAVGNGGNINITGRSLSVTNGAQLSVSTLGQGNTGSITLNAQDTVSFDGVGSNGFASGAVSAVAPGAEGNGSDIKITASSLSVTNGARLSTSTFGEGDAGSVTIDADKVSFDGVGNDGVSSAAFSTVDVGAVGNGGSINITTESLSLTNGAQLQASTFGQGDAGSVTINASDTVSFNGVGSNGFASGAVSAVAPGAEGNAGDIKITTGSLSVTNGAGVAVATAGRGNAANVTVNARDTVSFDGADVLSTVEEGAVGKSGDITITTGSFAMTNSTQLATSTFGQGKAGTITINASDTVSINGNSTIFSTLGETGVGKGGDIVITAGSLSMTNGAQLQASTFGWGDGGSVNINTRDTVFFDGIGSDGLPSAAASQVEQGAVGKGGNIDIRTESLSLTNGAVLSVNSLGQGGAGDIKVTVGSIELDNQAGIGATTFSGDGGNITLTVQDLLLLRHRSQISTTAGTAQAGGNGGNIDIDAEFIVAVPKENSDITANAFIGSGGRVEVAAEGIFGIEFRPRLTPLSDITASSEFGVDGVVEINTPDVDPSRGLSSLPTEPVNVEVAQSCQTEGGQSITFFNTGREGIAPNPYEPLDSSDTWEDVQPPTQLALNSTAASASTSPTTSKKIVEAQGWIMNANGNVVLVAELPATLSQGRCHLR
jgi:filamentous hemagglutinin family protein